MTTLFNIFKLEVGRAVRVLLFIKRLGIGFSGEKMEMVCVPVENAGCPICKVPLVMDEFG